MDINMNNAANTCPGCGRHCDLSAPHCPTGREYAETGKLPEGGHRHNHSHHEHQDTSNMNTNEKLLHSLRVLSRTLNHSAEPTGGQDRVLVILAEKGTIGQKELMDTLAVKAGSLSELLGKLENAGLIVRTRNEEDHRAVDVTLTEQGKKRAEEISAKKGSGDMFSALTEEDITQLTTLLDKLTQDWRQRFDGQESGQRHGHAHGHDRPRQGGHHHEPHHKHHEHHEHGHHGRRER